MKQDKKNKFYYAILIIIIISFIIILGENNHFFERPELMSLDIRTKLLRNNKALSPEIVLILIDESSLKTLNDIAGRWPWPRQIHADLIDFLSISGAKSIIMDILFTENQLEANQSDTNLGNNDLRLVEATKSAKNVYHATQIFTDLEDEYNKSILNKPLPQTFSQKFGINTVENDIFSNNNNYYLPFKKLYHAAKGIGVVSFMPDIDGVYRREKLLFPYQDKYFPSLAMGVFIDQRRFNKILINRSSLKMYGPNSLMEIPLTSDNFYYVNMYGKYNTFSYGGVITSIFMLKTGQVQDLPVQAIEFKDKVVFIGASAAGVEDLKNTSIFTNTPGVFLHASIYGNLISNDFLKFISPPLGMGIAFVLIIITIFSIFFLKGIFLRVIMPLVIWVAYLGFGFILFKNNFVIPFVYPSFALISAYISSFAYISLSEGRDKRRIRNILGQYVSPAILTTLLTDNRDEYLKAEIGRSENLTLFFSDIRDFTSISENFKVEQVVDLLNDYLSRMVKIIFNNEGTLDKFIGDAVMAFWGAPLKDPDHHYKAVLTAIQMIKDLKILNQENIDKDLPDLNIGIGIHTGDVILGNIGSEQKLDYTVIGDSVNLASRLEGLTKKYSCQILISQTTYSHVKERITCRLLDYIKVKGKKRPIKIYEVINQTNHADKTTAWIMALTNEAFKLYSTCQFEKAIGIYKQILEIKTDDFLSTLFIQRCQDFIQTPPPPDWDGSYAHESK